MKLYIETPGRSDDQGVWLQDVPPAPDDGAHYILRPSDPHFCLASEADALAWASEMFTAATVHAIDAVVFV